MAAFCFGLRSPLFEIALVFVRFDHVAALRRKRELKRIVKRRETRRILHETRAPVFAPSRFMVSVPCFIGETRWNEVLVSHFLPVRVKCEMRGRFLK